MAKKQLIMEKALELFAEQGFEATSVQQITDHCGISKGAFYLSFKSKDELILALIDHFMMQITSDIDYIVKNTASNEKLLYAFYYKIFENFNDHSDFAKILINEQTQSMNAELFSKIRHYDQLMEKNILLMVERLYSHVDHTIKYDLVYCIKGFMSMYSHLFLFFNIPLDLDSLCSSLVEKTDLLARYTTIPFISEELMRIIEQPCQEEATKEQILEILTQKLEDIEEPIEKESLLLLKQDLLNPAFSPAIVKGLLENIRHNPHCKWISFLLRRYYKF
ncbi:TetR/AcrR family transcriptional regulator [Mesobacillus foraminis]|uniref:TetR/AcrR family transcriptional regulator n=1 Tax=Mesobacillus foraminis TaxID=279826 RepID=UPI001BEAEF1C|nr:TetR/AcrR family transcriptional regulator [Mesobacillus foraminis]MBT2757494.1 TetR/AcrR family transcriptional regulator [Mesobacillus foraminis]